MMDDVLCEEEDTTLIADIKQHIITYLEDKYEDTDIKELYTSSFLDPRFKTEYIPSDNILAIKERISREGLQYATNSTDSNSSTILLVLPLKVLIQVHHLLKKH